MKTSKVRRSSLLLVAALLLVLPARALAVTEILVTNDDGPLGPGLQALVTAIQEIPDTDVQVVVPSGNASGGGAGVTINATFDVAFGVPLLGGVDTAITIDSLKPADCVRWAVQELYGGVAPDYVLSGINQGQNVGAAFGSGTVGGATQGNGMGARAIALSQAITLAPPLNLGLDVADYAAGAAFARNLVATLIAGDPAVRLLERTFERGGLLNVQIPSHQPVGVKVVKAADTSDVFGPSLITYVDQGGGTWSANVNLAVIDSHGPVFASHPLNDDAGPLAQDYVVIARWLPLHVARSAIACRRCQSLLP
ncbi:MAG: 5'/3'-nucleotidase SurE [Thermodesulfobacteriota bacterium]